MASILCGSGRRKSLEITCEKNLISVLQNLHLPRFMVKPEAVRFLNIASKCSRRSTNVLEKRSSLTQWRAHSLVSAPSTDWSALIKALRELRKRYITRANWYNLCWNWKAVHFLGAFVKEFVKMRCLNPRLRCNALREIFATAYA
jgi:hypothetical protein